MQQKRAAADAARLRLHQRQHHLHRNRRIDGTAARLEHDVARLGGQRIGGSHGELRGRPTRLFGIARGAFGLIGGRGELEGLRACGGAGGGAGTGTQQQAGSGCDGKQYANVSMRGRGHDVSLKSDGRWLHPT
ncbi:hypothetical protein SDC9_131446 [bioreactor metagenome]|uniref:Uncharacterized protein n=1 Tax=bioreactor metagenome TaxID=1076179 RepID=A0A645D578_9ZZZZ